MHLCILLSNTFNNLSSVFDGVEVSDAYVSTGLRSTLVISVLVLLDIKCDFRCFLSPCKHLFSHPQYLYQFSSFDAFMSRVTHRTCDRFTALNNRRSTVGVGNNSLTLTMDLNIL
jgi:hypothetical protein